jgi:hypothetical protein
MGSSANALRPLLRPRVGKRGSISAASDAYGTIVPVSARNIARVVHVYSLANSSTAHISGWDIGSPTSQWP